MPTFDHRAISKSVLEDFFRPNIQTFLQNNSGGYDWSHNNFVLTDYPDQNINYPHVILKEIDDGGSRIDPIVDLIDHDYQFEAHALAETSTELFKLKGLLKGYIQEKYQVEINEGLYDLELVSSSPANILTETDVKEWQLTIGLNLFSTTK